MSCQNCWKKVVPFALTLMFGLLAVNLFQEGNIKPIDKKPVYSNQENEIGYGGGSSKVVIQNAPLQVLSKPRANYTEAARQNQVQGTITLRVTFLDSGEIGSISTLNALPNGLTEQAVAAAREMKFEPARKDGVPYTVSKQVQYNFTLY